MPDSTRLVSWRWGAVAGVRAVVIIALVVRLLRRVKDVWLRFVQHV